MKPAELVRQRFERRREMNKKKPITLGELAVIATGLMIVLIVIAILFVFGVL